MKRRRGGGLVDDHGAFDLGLGAKDVDGRVAFALQVGRDMTEVDGLPSHHGRTDHAMPVSVPEQADIGWQSEDDRDGWSPEAPGEAERGGPTEEVEVGRVHHG
jgi:hypothetical protein